MSEPTWLEEFIEDNPNRDPQDIRIEFMEQVAFFRAAGRVKEDKELAKLIRKDCEDGGCDPNQAEIDALIEVVSENLLRTAETLYR